MIHLYPSIYPIYSHMSFCCFFDWIFYCISSIIIIILKLFETLHINSQLSVNAWFTRFLYMAPTSRYTDCGFDTELLCCLKGGVWGVALRKAKKKKIQQPWILFLSSDNPLPSHRCQKLNLQNKGGESTADKLQLSPDRWMMKKRQRLKRKCTPWKMKEDILQEVYYL